MNRLLALVLMVSGLVLAGTVYASMNRSDAATGERLWSVPDVRASVIYKSGNTISIYSPEGNTGLCVGDNIPIYRWSSTTFENRVGMDMMMTSRLSTAPDLATRKLVGEVRIFKHFGDNYAFGRLVVGDANAGDVAAKPTRSCLAS